MIALSWVGHRQRACAKHWENWAQHPASLTEFINAAIAVLTHAARAQIVELLNIVYCLAELAEFAAFLHLRRAAPHLRRPVKIRLPTWGCVLMLTPATALLAALIAQPLLDLDWMVSYGQGGAARAISACARM